jgi:hypothetical protein
LFGESLNLAFTPMGASPPNKYHVRFGSKADIAAPATNVRFTPSNRHSRFHAENSAFLKTGRVKTTP